MFGYINVNKNELSEENTKIYKAYYCGLCQKLREIGGAKAQMLLNYDMTFLVVLLTGLYEPEETSRTFICAAHPTKRHVATTSDITQYAACMNIALAYHNLVDDWKDNKSYTKKTMAKMIKKDYAKIAVQYPRQVKSIEAYMKELVECEQHKERNIDKVAGLTGEMLGEILAWKQDEWYKELKTLGLYLGKFIYLMDAYDDIEKDSKSDSYNPFVYLRKENPNDFETLSRLMMTSMISECARSFERLPILLHADILRNILYSGVWTKYEYIQLKEKKRNKK